MASDLANKSNPRYAFNLIHNGIKLRIVAQVLDQLHGMAYSRAVAANGLANLCQTYPQCGVTKIHCDLAHAGYALGTALSLPKIMSRYVKQSRTKVEHSLADLRAFFRSGVINQSRLAQSASGLIGTLKTIQVMCHAKPH
jgi:hypothetical protein